MCLMLANRQILFSSAKSCQEIKCTSCFDLFQHWKHLHLQLFGGLLYNIEQNLLWLINVQEQNSILQLTYCSKCVRKLFFWQSNEAFSLGESYFEDFASQNGCFNLQSKCTWCLKLMSHCHHGINERRSCLCPPRHIMAFQHPAYINNNQHHTLIYIG